MTFFKKIFFDFKISAIWYSVGLFFYAALIVWMFPFVKEMSQDFEKLLESYPPAMINAFGMDNTAMLDTIEGFLAVESYSLFWMVIMAIFTFSLGASIVAGEIENGTSKFSFTLPIKRKKIVFEKFIASYILLAGVILFNLIITIIGAYIIGEDPHIKGFLAFFALSLVLFFFLLSLANFFSCVLKSKGKVYGICGGFFATSYAIYILNGVSDKISDFYFFSFFKYYDPEMVLSSGALNIENTLIFLIAGFILFGASLILVEKRDL